jgi:hypothetical protein
MVILRICEALGMRRDGAGVKSTSSAAAAERTGWEAIRNRVFANLVCESCILIKLLLRLLRCRNARIGRWRLLICRADSQYGSPGARRRKSGQTQHLAWRSNLLPADPLDERR